LILNDYPAQAGSGRTGAEVVSRGFQVPRQPPLAALLATGALVGTLALVAAPAAAQLLDPARSLAASGGTMPTGGASDLDSSLMSPSLDGNPRRTPRFRPSRGREDTDRTRFGQLPNFSYQPGAGAGITGFDSTNARNKRRPGQAGKPGSKPASGAQPKPGTGSKPLSTSTAGTTSTGATSPSTTTPASSAGATTTAPADAADALAPNAPPTPKQLQPAAAPLPGRYFLQNRPGAPPATPDGVIATLATTPPYRRQPFEERPFDPIGIPVGAFNFRPAFEYTRGWDGNAPRNSGPPTQSSWFNVYAPELLVNSNWDRHELTAGLRGSFTTYDTMHSLDRPNLDSKVDARIDVSRDTHLLMEGRYLLFTDYPGSPNIQAGLAHLPIAMTYGSTFGIDQRFNRLDVTVKGTFDRTVYNDSEFLDGETASNAGRNFNRYGGQLRAGYDVMPGAQPFVEVGTEERRYDLQFDAGGNDRTSWGSYGKVGTTLDFARKLVGEVSVGYLTRSYRDPTLPAISGWTVDSALSWFATPLTTVKLINTTTVTETVLTGVSGVFTRETTLQVEHAFRRWLLATVKFTRGVDDYIGSTRQDLHYVASTALAYTLTREIWLRGEYRNEWRRSNQPGNDYFAHVWLVGVRLQR
jgi:hypothetical protein